MKRLAVSTFAICLFLGALAQERVIGDWLVELEIDPITDEVMGFMYASAWDNPEFLYREAEGGLGIVCDHDSVVVAFLLDRTRPVLGRDYSDVPVYRIDRGRTRYPEGEASKDGTLFVFGYEDARLLIRDLSGTRDFVFRIDAGEEGILTYHVRVSGFVGAYAYARREASCPPIW